jgi:hypothetical protein
MSVSGKGVLVTLLAASAAGAVIALASSPRMAEPNPVNAITYEIVAVNVTEGPE